MTFSRGFSFLDGVDRLDESKLVFHFLIRNFESPMHFSNDLSYGSSKGFPLFLLALLPVIGPEVVIWFEHGHVHSFACHEGRHAHDALGFQEPSGISTRLEQR